MPTQDATSDHVVEQVDIRATPDRVFDALVDPKQLGRWWGDSGRYRTRWELDLRLGGEYVCYATGPDGSEMEVRGRFLEIDRPRKLAYTWNASWDPSGETTVVYEITPSDLGTLVRVTQSGFASDADRAGYKDGWGHVLAWLGSWVEVGERE